MERCIKISYVLDLLSSYSAKIHTRDTKNIDENLGACMLFYAVALERGKEQGSPMAEAVDWAEHTYARQVVVQR